MSTLTKKLFIAFVSSVVLFFASSLQAYVLQGRHVLDLMIEKLGPGESLLVTEKLIYYRMADVADEPESEIVVSDLPSEYIEDFDLAPAQPVEARQQPLPTEPVALEGTLRYVFSRAFRSDVRSSNSERIHVDVDGRTLTVIDSNIEPDTVNRFDLFKDVLLYRSRETLAERLLQLGVDPFVSSLGRFEDKVAFVIGAYYPDETSNQLWVDKETLLPLRLIIRSVYGADSSSKVEIRYLIWWKIGESRYPSKIEFYQDDELVRLSQAQNFEENAMFSEDLFDIEYLKALYPRLPMQLTEPETAEEPSEVQKTIEDFKRIFE